MINEDVPTIVKELVIGLVDDFNFMNVADPDNPIRLALDLSERCELVFTLSYDMVKAGWTFQRLPIEIRNDYGVNFSSYVWVENLLGDVSYGRTRFKIIYECCRMGEYEYTLYMNDRFGQSIALDPKIENGAGRVP